MSEVEPKELPAKGGGTTIAVSSPRTPSPIGDSTNRPSRRRGYRSLLVLHISVSAAVIGIDLAILLLVAAGLAGADPTTVYPALRIVAAWGLAPMAVVALTTGVILGWLGLHRLMRSTWVTIKLVVTAALTVLVLTRLLPTLGAASEAATGVAAPTALTDGRRLLLVLMPATGLLLLLSNVTLAVFKPRWRLRQVPTASAVGR